MIQVLKGIYLNFNTIEIGIMKLIWMRFQRKESIL